MNLHELGSILGDMYRTAPDGETVAMIHLFGVKYADEIKSLQASARDIAMAAGINESYATEINKGVHLAKYVTVK